MVGDVMELHVVIRDTNAPAGSTARPAHPVAWLCVFESCTSTAVHETSQGLHLFAQSLMSRTDFKCVFVCADMQEEM